jgi:di/tricarboxylate transporter
VWTIALLFIIAAGLQETGVLDYASYYLLGRVQTPQAVLWRLGLVLIPLSAFLNNTPLVAMCIPMVLDWSRRHSVSPSKLLIPLSFLVILGGNCSLIGTSTTLVLDGLMKDQGLRGMTFFEISWIGLPCAVFGFLYLFCFSSSLLPDRKEFLVQLGESRREYLAEMRVERGCRLVGQTVEAAGLRQLPGLFLIEISRQEQILSPVDPGDRIEAEDHLMFTGIVSSILELEKIPFLTPIADPHYEVSPSQQRKRRLCEAVISETSPLIGKTIREAEFRATYGAAVVAVHRGGARISQKVGDIRLYPGDTLLLQTSPHFLRAYRDHPAFYLISGVEDWRPLRRDRAGIAFGLFIFLVLMMALGVLPIVVTAGLTALAMILFNCISSGDARQSIDWQVLLTISLAFAVGKALEKTGLAMSLAQVLLLGGTLENPWYSLALIFGMGALFTSFITNNATVILLFPLCLEMAHIAGRDPFPFLMTLTCSASLSFLTPIGYQTNMMVYGPGGYRFSDFFKIGFPLNLLLGFLVVGLVPLIWNF